MKNIFKNKKEVVGACLLILMLASFIFFDPFKYALDLLNKKDHTFQCALSLSEAKDTLKFMYSLSGIPEDKMDQAVENSIIENCKCILAKAGKINFNDFMANDDNTPTIQKCSEEATQKTIKDYSTAP